MTTKQQIIYKYKRKSIFKITDIYADAVNYKKGLTIVRGKSIYNVYPHNSSATSVVGFILSNFYLLGL